MRPAPASWRTVKAHPSTGRDRRGRPATLLRPPRYPTPVKGQAGTGLPEAMKVTPSSSPSSTHNFQAKKGGVWVPVVRVVQSVVQRPPDNGALSKTVVRQLLRNSRTTRTTRTTVDGMGSSRFVVRRPTHSRAGPTFRPSAPGPSSCGRAALDDGALFSGQKRGVEVLTTGVRFHVERAGGAQRGVWIEPVPRVG